MRARPRLVLWQTVRDLEPRGLRADEEVSFGLVVRRLIQASQGNSNLVWIIVVRADQVRATHGAEVLDDELRRVVTNDQVLAPRPFELGSLDRCTGSECRTVPPATLGTVAMKDGAQLAFDLISDPLAKTTTGKQLHRSPFQSNAAPNVVPLRRGVFFAGAWSGLLGAIRPHAVAVHRPSCLRDQHCTSMAKGKT